MLLPLPLQGKGKSEEIKETSNELFIIFGLAFLTAYLVMAATFNSFIHPFIIMLTVPLALFGGLVFILFLNSSINIFSQIALVILIGISTKNSILIVDYANQLRTAGKNIEISVKEACQLRFRPIMMTSISTMIAMIPLVIGNIGPGAGEASRLAVGTTILGGMIISTFFTLYVTPTMYLALARNSKRIDSVDIELKKELSFLDKKDVEEIISDIENFIIEEKNNRIVEVLISSVKPFQLMMGKIVGIALVGLTQFALWIILTSAITGIIGQKFAQDKSKLMSIEKTVESSNSDKNDPAIAAGEVLNALSTINYPLVIGCFLFYFLGGYLLYSALFAAIGSAVDSESETQQFMMPVTIPLIFSFIISNAFINDYLGLGAELAFREKFFVF